MSSKARDSILSASKRAKERVSIPEWAYQDDGGKEVCEFEVWEMDGTERDSYEASMLAAAGGRPNLNNVRARLVVRTLHDLKGNRVFATADADQLGKTPAGPIIKAFEVAQRVNKLSQKDVEELVGNSKPAPSDGSTSG